MLWRALQQQLFYHKTEWIYEYWAFAHQYIFITLKPIDNQYYSSDNVGKRQKQIEHFKEFHLMLCGYIIFVEEYDLLEKIVGYTQSEPYSFPLVPSSLIEIIHAFEKLENISSESEFRYASIYPFTGVKGINSIYTALAWTKRYLILLLFRLNTVDARYSDSNIITGTNNNLGNGTNELEKNKNTLDRIEFFLKDTRTINIEEIAIKFSWYNTDSKSGEKNKNHPLNKILHMKSELSKQQNNI